MEALLILVIVAALLALGYAAFNFIGVKNLDEGTDRMKEIAAAIRVGANAFITYEYKIIAVVSLYQPDKLDKCINLMPGHLIFFHQPPTIDGTEPISQSQQQ